MDEDEDVNDAIIRQRLGSVTTARRRSIPIFGKQNKVSRMRSEPGDTDALSDDSGSIMSLHRDPLHRTRSMLTWRQQPTDIGHLANADRNNNNNDNNGKLKQK